jgi:hypothetical protein
VIILVLLCIPFFYERPAFAEVQAEAGDFTQGSLRGSILGGSGRAFNQTYFVLGGGMGYYLFNGLESGLDFEAWFGNDPRIYKVSPRIRYVIPLTPAINPYVGRFYSRTFIEELDDFDSFGFRGGFFNTIGPNAYVGVGVVYERLLNCEESIYKSCSVVYPEVLLSIGF